MSKDPTITIANGALLGNTKTDLNGDAFYSFLGIPYAKPPVGNLRFKSPEPSESWEGVRDARIESQQCIQFDPNRNEISGSEDCLYLNVFTRNFNENGILKPVMVWIHGGAYTSGSNHTDMYGPEFLLTEDIVLVVINYRLGIFGFMNFEDDFLNVPGNAGMKDMVQALKWVQSNISAFHGDPNNVTIFGESAGGSAVHYLVLSPLTKGLFHKAILQSGCASNLWARGKNCVQEIADVLYMKNATEKDVFSVLLKLTEKDLYNLSKRVSDIFFPSFQRPFAPTIEKSSKDAFISQDPEEIIKSGNYVSVPMIIGYNTREGMLHEMLVLTDPDHQSALDFDKTIPYTLKNVTNRKELAQKIKKFYYGDQEPSDDLKDTRYLLETDGLFVREILNLVQSHSHTSTQPIYLYRMSVQTKLNFMKIVLNITLPGVCHADDLGYFWKNIIITSPIQPRSDEDVGLRRFVKLWTNFAKTGNPNSKENVGLIKVEWTPINQQELNFLDIGNELSTGVNPEKKRMEFWQQVFQENCK